jgi:hypothetical protein
MTNNRRWLIPVLAVIAACCLIVPCFGIAAYTLLTITGSDITIIPTEGEFSGYYTSGFEVSSFVPCGNPTAEPGYGVGYWLSSEPEAGFYEQYSEISAQVSPPPGGYVTVFTRFRGRLSPPGSYGHLGAYSREVTVVEVLEMSVEGTCEE